MKGEATRTTILDAALSMARLEGLDALSIGRLAKAVGLSKSGLFGHFKSKEALQLQILERAVTAFTQGVVLPAIKRPRGEPRLRALVENWRDWAVGQSAGGGCVFVGAAVEYDDKPGTVRDFLVETQHQWIQALSRAVTITKEEGHLNAEVDPDQLAFELYGSMLAWHLYFRLLGDKDAWKRVRTAFDNLLNNNR